MLNQFLGGDDPFSNLVTPTHHHSSSDINVVGSSSVQDISAKQRLKEFAKRNIKTTISVIGLATTLIIIAFITTPIYDVCKTAFVIASKGASINAVSSIIMLKIYNQPLDRSHIHNAATIGAITGSIGSMLATGVHAIFIVVWDAIGM